MNRALQLFIIVLLLFSSETFIYGIIVEDISVKGNVLSSERLISKNIRTRSGSSYNARILNEDIKRLYELGRFSKIEVKETRKEDFISLIFVVVEKPIVKETVFDGNKQLKSSDLSEGLLVVSGSRYDEATAVSDEARILQVYKDKGFLFASVEHKISYLDENKKYVRLTFSINENSEIKIGGIKFVGNSHIDKKYLHKIMQTKIDRFFGSGIFDPEKFSTDLNNILLYYKTQGYLDAVVEHGKSYFSEDKTWLYLNVQIEEGQLYIVNSIEFLGNQIVDTPFLLQKINTRIGMPYSDKLKWEIESELESYYGEIGRVFTRIRVSSSVNENNSHVAIKVEIAEGQLLHLEEVKIYGNTRTKDVVIRRELSFYPKERVDTKLIRESERNLRNLGFFDKADIVLERGSKEGFANAIVRITEKQTGSINFALGFSSIESIFGQIKYVQRNFDWRDRTNGYLGMFNGQGFLGDGQYLEVAINTGSESRRFTLDFSEPWVFNRKIRFGFGLFHTESNIAEDFDENRDGLYLRLGKEFKKDFEGFVTYNISTVNISDIALGVSPAIREQEGKNTVSSLKNDWVYDSRNNKFFTTAGMYSKTSFTVAGSLLGGDQDFYKAEFEIKNYLKAFQFGSGKNIHVLSSRFRLGYADSYADSTSVPIFERFFAGGLGTVRGFENRSLGPIEISNGERFEIGGNFLTVFNLEYNIPISEETFRAVIFYDQGNVYNSVSDVTLDSMRSSVGVGLRVQIDALGPFPISLDFAKPIQQESGDQTETFSFNFGNFF